MKPKTLFGVITVGLVLVYIFAPIASKLIKLKNQEASLESDIRQLARQNAVLSNELKLLRTDPVYVEQLARRTFKKAKKGEVVYQFVPADQLPKK